MNPKLFHLLCGITLGAVAMWGLPKTNTPQHAAQPNAEKPKPLSIEDMQTLRRNTLADALKAQLAEFRGGRCSVHPILYLNDQLLSAELEIRKQDAARRQAYDFYLLTARELENNAKANLDHGTGTKQEVLTVKAQRLQAAILLAQLQQGAKD